MKKMKRRLWTSLMALTLWIATVGCSSASSIPENTAAPATPSEGSAQTIKIGVIVSETGPASSLGKPEAETARLLKKQIEGQLFNGKKVELIISDNETNDTNAVVIAKKMVSQDKVIAIVGGTQTSTSVAISEVAKENKLPLIALAPLSKEVLGEYVFQVTQSNATVLQTIIDYLKSNNITSVAWTNARDAFGQSGLPIFKELAKANHIEIVAVEDFDGAATDMTVQLTKIKPKKPGAVIVWSRPPGAGIIAKNFNQLGFDVPMIQSHAVSNEGFLKQIGAEGEGVLAIGSKMNILDALPDSEQKQLLMKFNDEFQKEYGTSPGPFGGYMYDGIHLVLKAISNGHESPQAIRDYIESGLGKHLGVTGTFEFSADVHDAAAGDGLALLRVAKQGWEPAR
ncbi:MULTISPECIES: ABC transporter substrate-binding protein [Paenibacillus]|uniref:Periplasmic binding protein n=1 Tax=Paenibacillus naphthalenovorans TaxID=162209 RepID=A0A0U2VM61_9BACL|nr:MULTISPECIES: ABC transporter substrate-binding protein [Paenibacillus]ALS21830.1 periplasmic binding protein [Paenibacillus naphthalenovorans]SDI81245.1 branched-chain amino acid transport system substrate-binding protein [Paenibacillus naphthalenovorans]